MDDFESVIAAIDGESAAGEQPAVAPLDPEMEPAGATVEPEPAQVAEPEPAKEPEPQVIDDPDIAAIVASESESEIGALRREIEQLKAAFLPSGQEQAGPREFVNEEEFDEILQDRAKLNAKLNEVYAQAAQSAAAQASAEMRRQLQMQQMANDFYTANPDLQPYREFVGTAADTLIKRNPNLTYAQLMDKVAKATRFAKKLPTPIKSGAKPAKSAAGLPAVGGRAGNPAQRTALTGFDAEVDAMLKVVGE